MAIVINGKEMVADKALTADLEKATTVEEIRALCHGALERSGVVQRDPESGQFVSVSDAERREAAAKVVAETAKVFSKVERIGNEEFQFTAASQADLDLQISNALKVANAVHKSIPVAKTPQQTAYDRATLDVDFRTGKITSAQYLERSGAIDEYMAAKGIDINKIANDQYTQSWAAATDYFRTQTEEGKLWKGGNKNLHIAAALIAKHGWTDEPSVEHLVQVAQEMRENGIMLDGDYSAEEVAAMTDKMTPQEILEAWKESTGSNEIDATAANELFIQQNRIHEENRGR